MRHICKNEQFLQINGDLLLGFGLVKLPRRWGKKNELCHKKQSKTDQESIPALISEMCRLNFNRLAMTTFQEVVSINTAKADLDQLPMY